MKKYKLIIIYVFITNLIFAQANSKIEIPFTMDRNLILINAKVGSAEISKFIFDTGTEGIMLLDSIATQYTKSGFDTIVTPQGEFVGTQQKVLIPDIQFDNLALKNMEAIMTPKQMLFSDKVVGIIGLKAFVGYLFTLDFANYKIVLERGELKRQSNVIPINLDHILEAKVMINNKEMLAHFDCGGAGFISIPKNWNSIYKLKADPILQGKGFTPMGDFDVFKAELDGDIDIGNYKISNPQINLVTGDFFFAINFGYEFFKEHLITIDTKNSLMEIKLLKDK